MDKRPIGVFDSGLGGLTTVRELMRAMPGEDIVYFGDTGRVPYGTRSRDTIIKYAMQDIAFIHSFDAKAVVIACGTVSSVAHDTIAGKFDVPMIGTVKSSAALAVSSSVTGRIGVIGTQGTINSGAFGRMIRELRPDAKVFEKACPLFVPLVENGRYLPCDEVVKIIVHEYLEELKNYDIDTLVLGCTHYPLLAEVIGEYMGDSVTLINSGAAAVSQLDELLNVTEKRSGRTDGGNYSFYVSDSVESFEKYASMFLGRSVCGSVSRVEIEKY